ncbi:PREDICTED: phosphatidate phosphatase PAH1-like [Ipomoea nil]|uniref:phosphatidate phosphatase PAH1-like n=1 Tax=Ipomoea nil TaxID=35883 RepID=UPI000901AE15|nr:PREDICTED: phosphatidate phosphatase PAH1-like [Ipomoea nil]XP_019185125.1 PREDICTED: phosphatidate phosphatase PAH1-like [Ipomoea nil]XP_019185134.1 PREDICTED: phosphatidate phosphatase PAH1-like [Ipomoea nil]
MNVVGKVGSIITAGVYSVATPFHPFGGAVDIISVKQQDGSFRSTPWYVRFGKFQGVLKGAEKEVRIEVNGVEADFHMYLDNSGEAYFIREVDSDKENEGNEFLKDTDSFDGSREGSSIDNANGGESSPGVHSRPEPNDDESEMQDERLAFGVDRFDRTESGRRFYELDDVDSSLDGSIDLSGYESSLYENLETVEQVLESQNSGSEVVLVSVDGHILTAPISSSERNTENVELATPQFHLGPGEETDFCETNTEINTAKVKWGTDNLSSTGISTQRVPSTDNLSSSNSEHGPADHLLEVSKETSYVEAQDQELLRNESGESTPSGIKKGDIFASCLELPELALQVENDSKLSDIASPRSPLAINGTENGSSEKFENNGLPSSCDISCSSPLSDVQVEAKTLDNSDSDRAHVRFVCNGEASEKQIEGTPDAKELESSQARSDECTQCKSTRLEIALCGHLLHPGMGSGAAAEVFNANRISEMEFKNSAKSIIKNENLVARIQGKYLSWEKAASIILGMAAYDLELPIEYTDVIPVEHGGTPKSRVDDSGIERSASGRRWRLWPIPFRRVKTLEHTSSNVSNEDVFLDSESSLQNQAADPSPTARGGKLSPRKQLVRTNVPTSEQIDSLNLKDGQNMVVFIFSTRVLGVQKVEAHIYLWKWNARIVISDVDGTITKSDVLGQFMPLVGKDWTHSGIARLFSAIKENGYQLLFLSARAIVQAYLTKSFLFNLKQDGKTLPIGPVVISPDGLFPSLYREVIRRAPHEFKIACLEDIKALFPPDYNPFYAGFGNRDTDELSYRKIGIPKGKIFIINPKGEVAISHHRIDVKSYTSLHTLVNDMFPPTSMVEQEDYNSWNYWKMPLPELGSL